MGSKGSKRSPPALQLFLDLSFRNRPGTERENFLEMVIARCHDIDSHKADLSFWPLTRGHFLVEPLTRSLTLRVPFRGWSKSKSLLGYLGLVVSTLYPRWH